MKRHFLFLALVCCIVLLSCKKDVIIRAVTNEDISCCGVDDPLNQLNWLHDCVYQFEQDKNLYRAEVYLCRYGSDNDGFLITNCVDCPDAGLSFCDCSGQSRGILFGFAGIGYEEFGIDPQSVRCIYRNYDNTPPRLTGKRWELKKFVDRINNRIEIPNYNGNYISFWLIFGDDGTIVGGGVNQLLGRYIKEGSWINIEIQGITEIYDISGWEEIVLEALNSVIECDVHHDRIRLYYNTTATYMEFE